MSTPRQNGLESEVYAVGKEADAVGVQGFKDRAHDVAQRLINQWAPVFQAGGIRDDTEKLAAEMATTTGRPNCLDVDDKYGPVGTQLQEAFVGGDTTASLQVAGESVVDAVKDDATAVGDAAKAAASAATSGAKWLIIGVVAIAVILVVGRKVL